MIDPYQKVSDHSKLPANPDGNEIYLHGAIDCYTHTLFNVPTCLSNTMVTFNISFPV